MMFKLFPCRIALGCLALAALWLAPAEADTLHLRDGKTLTGTIDEASSNDSSIVIRTVVGTQRVPRARIERIEQASSFSPAEAAGDTQAASGQLDRAAQSYKDALQAEPKNARIQQKLKQLQERITQRTNEAFGPAFSKLNELIKTQQFDQALEEGNALLQRIRQPEAQATAQQLIAEAYVGRARLSRDRVAYPEAEKDYLQAMQIAPDQPVAYLELADMLQLSPARKLEAIPYYTKGVELAEKSGQPLSIQGGRTDQASGGDLLEYRFRLGRLYMDQKQFDKAATTYLEVMRLDTEYRFPQAVEFAVDSYSRIKTDVGTTQTQNLDDVVKNLETILALKPNEPRAHLLLGKIMYDRQDWQAAHDRFERVVKLGAGQTNPPTLEGLYLLGVTSHKLGNLAEAEQSLQQLVNARAASYDAVTELAEVKMEQSDYPRAMELFNQALQLDQDKYRAWLGLGEALQKLERYDEARSKLQEVVKRDPTNARAQLRIAQSYYLEEKWDESATEAKKALKLLDDKTTDTRTDEDVQTGAEAYTLMGRNNLNLNKPNLARENFEAALAKLPNFAAALDGIGKTQQANGMHEEAEKFFEQAIAADPKNPEYHLSLGISWHQFRKNPENAMPHYLEYVKLGGKDPNVRKWIKECGGQVPEPTAQPGS